MTSNLRSSQAKPVRVPITARSQGGAATKSVPIRVRQQQPWGPFSLTRNIYRFFGGHPKRIAPNFEAAPLLRRLDSLNANSAAQVRANRVEEYERALARSEIADLARREQEMNLFRDLQLPSSLPSATERFNAAGNRATTPHDQMQSPVEPYGAAQRQERGLTASQARAELKTARTILDEEGEMMRRLGEEAKHDPEAARALIQAQQGTHVVVGKAVSRAVQVRAALPVEKANQVQEGGTTGLFDRAEMLEQSIDHEEGDVRSYLKAEEDAEDEAADHHRGSSIGM